MKRYTRIIGAVCAAAAAFSSITPFSASASSFQQSALSVERMGDVNHDMIVTADDSTEVLSLYLDGVMNNTIVETTAENAASDVTLDGQIDADDSNAILSYYLRDMIGETPLWADYREISYVDTAAEHTSPFALKDFYVEVGCAEGAPGEQVTVPIYIAGATALSNFQYLMQPEGLEPVSVQCKLDNTLVQVVEKDKSQEYRYFTGDEMPDNYSICATNAASGVIAWCNGTGDNTSFKDGTIIAEYTYKIPENAKSGGIIQLNPMNEPDKYCKFSCWDPSESDDQSQLEGYQYTFLGGVVAVK